MKVKQIFTHNSLRNFSYIIHDDKTAFCIDPFDSSQILPYLEDNHLTLKAIINTHEHGDHTHGNADVQKNTNAPIWTHRDAVSKIPNAIKALAHDEIIELSEGNYIKVLDTPGHTMSHICLLVHNDHQPIAVITGDCIFNAGVGNCHNGGAPEVMYETVKDIILKLPDNVIVYPGHDYLENNLSFCLSIDKNSQQAKELLQKYPQNSTDFIEADLGLEKQINLFFRTDEKAIQDLVLNDHSSPNKDKATFLKLRELRNNW